MRTYRLIPVRIDEYLRLVPVKTAGQIRQTRKLFREYAAALGVDICFQNFNAELANLPGDYSPPGGVLYLAEFDQQLAGCVALREIDPGICEMKRLYVRPKFRGKQIGRTLAERMIADARRLGYHAMILDTLSSLKP